MKKYSEWDKVKLTSDDLCLLDYEPTKESLLKTSQLELAALVTPVSLHCLSKEQPGVNMTQE